MPRRESVVIDTPQIVETAAQQVAGIHVVVPRDAIRSVMGPAHRDLMAAVEAQGIATTGPWCTHHPGSPSETFDFEIGVAVARPVAPSGRVRPGRLPAATVARSAYHGRYEGLGEGGGEFMSGIGAEGHVPAADFREVHVAGPETGADASRYRAELNRPLLLRKPRSER